MSLGSYLGMKMAQAKFIFRLIPLMILVLGLFLVIYFKLYHYLSFEALQQHRDLLLKWANQHYFITALSFCFIYIIAVAISIPGAVFLTLAGGFLFGLVWGTVYVVFSATIGATLLFLAINTSFGHWLRTRANEWVKKMEAGFKRNAFHYLLTLRLIPLFPFWLVNIVPALLNVPLRTFVTATFLGIIPGAFVYISVGHGLNRLFATGKKPELGIIFSPDILLPLIGLAVLSLLPVAYNHLKDKQHAKKP